MLFHLGKLIPPQGVPDTYGFNGLDNSQCTGDTVALSYSGGIGLPSVVKFRWNGNGVELIANAGALIVGVAAYSGCCVHGRRQHHLQRVGSRVRRAL